MSYQEPPHLIELVAGFCALPLLAAYRLEGGGVGPAETLVWFAVTWALASAARTWWTIGRGHGASDRLSGAMVTRAKQGLAAASLTRGPVAHEG